MKNWMIKEARENYLWIVCAKGYEDQVHEIEYIRWYDLLLLMIPIFGFLIFIETIRNRDHDNIRH